MRRWRFHIFHIFHILTAPSMAASVGAPTYYIRAAAIRRGDGAQASLDWKAWGHEDGLRWDMQRVGVCFQTVDDDACPKATLSRWWKARIPLFKEAWEHWGLDVGTCFTPSRRASVAKARYTEEEMEVNDHTHDVGAFTTKALLLVIEHITDHARSKRAQCNAFAIQQAFIELTLPGNIWELEPWLDVSAAMLADCPVTQGSAVCTHVAVALDLVDGCSGSKQWKMWAWWRMLARLSSTCPACKGWGKHVLELIVAHIDRRVAVAAYTTDPTKAVRPKDLAKKRKKEEDEDYKKAVVGVVLSSGRATSAHQHMRSTGDHRGSEGGAWSNAALAEYQSASWLNAVNMRSVSLSADAARIGNPGEDTTTLASWVTTSRGSFGSILPPQVSSGRWHWYSGVFVGGVSVAM